MPDGRQAPDLLTAEEAGEFLRLSDTDVRRSLSRYRRMGLLYGLQIGRNTLYRRQDLLAFVERMSAVNPR